MRTDADWLREHRANIEEGHKGCVEQCLNSTASAATSIGCYKDSWWRDLSTDLGKDLTIEGCIAAG